MISTMEWLDYNALFSVMTAHGFTSETRTDGGKTFRHPHGEILPFPDVALTDPVITYHYGAVQASMDNYGIMTRDAFELALLQEAHKVRLEPTPVPTPA